MSSGGRLGRSSPRSVRVVARREPGLGGLDGGSNGERIVAVDSDGEHAVAGASGAMPSPRNCSEAGVEMA